MNQLNARCRSRLRSERLHNCPFDAQYRKLFHAVVFTVQDCGFIARCSLEINNAAQVRVTKILQLIAECRIGIHDLSRTELDRRHRLPRFNMPLELGMFFGAAEYGVGRQRQKTCLILDREPYRYQKFCSDIAGQDIAAHGGKVEAAVGAVRDFLRDARPTTTIPGRARIYQRYLAFSKRVPILCRQLDQRKSDLNFNDYANLVAEWLKTNASP